MYTVKEITDKVTEIASKIPGVLKVTLVGSYAKDYATAESDVDLVVDLAENENYSNSFFTFIFDLEDVFGEDNVDLLTRNGVEKSCLRDDILKGGRLIYEV